MYIENYKILLKKIGENINKWKDILCSCFWTWIIIKWQHSAKWSIHLMQSLSCLFWREDKLFLMLIWKSKGPRTAKTVFKKTKLQDTDFLTSKFIINFSYSRQCGSNIRTDIKINGLQLKLQKWTLVFVVNWFLTSDPETIREERIVFSTNGAETTGGPYREESS